MILGLSSLGRSESRVLPNLDAVIATLGALAGRRPEELPRRPLPRSFLRGQRLLDSEVKRVFGAPQHRRHVRLMATLSADSALSYACVRDLILSGMDVARINCAHDTPGEWLAMISNIRQAEKETARQCKVEMDLCGPRFRTGAVVFPREPVRLHAGDRIFLASELASGPGRPPSESMISFQILPAGAGLKLQPGQPVWINDGKLGAVTERAAPGGMILRVVHARKKGENLAPEQGLNFPECELHLSPLTDKDLGDLQYVARHADIIGYSFVQDAADIDLLHQAPLARGRSPDSISLVLKIETARALDNLPELIVRAASKQSCAVMIARGDLAIEVGWERLALIQEKILWLCEAAHIPVIWATQVLERLVKKGSPSRAEVTDAAMAVRAECIMLNKGPYLAEGLRLLNEVLLKMQIIQAKKTPYLAPLDWSISILDGFGERSKKAA